MTSPHPIHPTPPLDRQHLTAFTADHYGETLQAVRMQALRGGLQPAGVFRVQGTAAQPNGPGVDRPIRRETGARGGASGADDVSCAGGPRG
jgi:hypothetical protein